MIKITALDHNGRGIGKLNNKVIFVPNTLIDEEVEVVIINNKSSYMEGEVTKYIKVSPQRKQVKCPYYRECGGCDLLHMDYDDELNFKLNKVNNILNKYCHTDSLAKQIIRSDKEYNYRNKATFKVDNKLGYYKRKSNDIVYINNCLLLDNKINSLIDSLNALDLSKVKEIMVRVFDQIMISITGEIEPKEVLDLGDIIIINDKVIKGEEKIVARISKYNFKVSHKSFFQINKFQIENLYNQVLNYLELSGKENVLDLYCGTGTIGIYISEIANQVIGVEINKAAIDDANLNKEINKISNTQFINKDVKELDLNSNIDRIILDPPRSGLDDGVTDKIIEISPEIIVYVSCDPMTMARDINSLSSKYKVEEVTLIDMFPKTYHVESVVKLIKK